MGVLAFSSFDSAYVANPLHATSSGSGTWSSAYDYAMQYVQGALAGGSVNRNTSEFADAVRYIIDYATVNGLSDNLLTTTGLAQYINSGGLLVGGIVPLLLYQPNATLINRVLSNLPADGSYVCPPPASLIDFAASRSDVPSALSYCERAFQYAIDHNFDIDPAALHSFAALPGAQAWIGTRLHPAGSRQDQATAILGNKALRQLLDLYLLGTWVSPADVSPLSINAILPGYFEGPAGGGVFTDNYSLPGGEFLCASLLRAQAENGVAPDAAFLAKLDTLLPDAAALVRSVYLTYQLDHGQNFDPAILASLSDYEKEHSAPCASLLIEAQAASYLQTSNRLLDAGAVTENTTVRQPDNTFRVYLDQMGYAQLPKAGDTVYVEGATGAGAAAEVGHSSPLTDDDIRRGYVDIAIVLPNPMSSAATYAVRSMFRSDDFTSVQSPALDVTVAPAAAQASFAVTGATQWSRYDAASNQSLFTFEVSFSGDQPITNVFPSSLTCDYAYLTNGVFVGNNYQYSGTQTVSLSNPSVFFDATTGKLQATFSVAGNLVDDPGRTLSLGLELRVPSGAVKNANSYYAGTNPTTVFDFGQFFYGSDGMPVSITSQPLTLLTQNTLDTARTTSATVARTRRYADQQTIEIYKTIDPRRAQAIEEDFKNAALWDPPPPVPAALLRDDYSLAYCWSAVQPMVKSVLDALNKGLDKSQDRADRINLLNGFMKQFNQLNVAAGSGSIASVNLSKTPAEGDATSVYEQFCNAYQQYFDATNDNPASFAVTANSATALHPNGVLTFPDEVTFGTLTSTINSVGNSLTTLGNQSQLDTLSTQSNLQTTKMACEALAKMLEILADMMNDIYRVN